MFGDVAPTYDLLNHALSLQIDRRWRRRAVRMSLRPDDCRVLDLCCGTGDFAIAFGQGLGARGRVVGIDFARPMLELFRRKRDRLTTHDSRLTIIEADGLRTPFPDATFDVVSIAFGLRNLDDTAAGILEMARLVRPGGRVVILEFCPPTRHNLFHRLFDFYFHHVLPRIGRLVSRHPTAYSYLPQSVEGFPPRERIVELLAEADLQMRVAKDLSGGIATLFVAERR
jgi:demethylmenaquinone methyltransferase/2-methoxy-6-polyprenyl-1,4-benzoquinol methylase